MTELRPVRMRLGDSTLGKVADLETWLGASNRAAVVVTAVHLCHIIVEAIVNDGKHVYLGNEDAEKVLELLIPTIEPRKTRSAVGDNQ